MVKLDVWTRFHELTSKKRKPTGRPNEEFYPMGFMPPYHEPWLYGESTGGYRGCYLQATKGDCDYDCPDDMCGTWDHSAHQQCLGMTTEAAALKYVELVTAMFGDQELICKVCAARGWHCFGEEEGCACTGPETRKGVDRHGVAFSVWDDGFSPLHSFANSERAAQAAPGLAVVRGWALYERLDRPSGSSFVAERYWWNALPDSGGWVDLTPRPAGWQRLLLAEAADDEVKRKSTLSTADARLQALLLAQRFP
ncbi:unnamed protein product, partial [Polarella glacialis]